jgi:hypothetical protein
MSALGQRQTLSDIKAMSALPPKADIAERDWHVRFVPKVDIRLGYSITSSALPKPCVTLVEWSRGCAAALREFD